MLLSSADYRFPYWVTGSQQDSGADAVLTRSNHDEISNRDWEPTCAGGESGYTAPDPLHPNILFGGTVTRCNVIKEAFAAVDRHRLTDNEPYIYRTRDGGKTWTRITKGLDRGVYSGGGKSYTRDLVVKMDPPE